MEILTINNTPVAYPYIDKAVIDSINHDQKNKPVRRSYNIIGYINNDPIITKNKDITQVSAEFISLATPLTSSSLEPEFKYPYSSQYRYDVHLKGQEALDFIAANYKSGDLVRMTSENSPIVSLTLDHKMNPIAPIRCKVHDGKFQLLRRHSVLNHIEEKLNQTLGAPYRDTNIPHNGIMRRVAYITDLDTQTNTLTLEFEGNPNKVNTTVLGSEPIIKFKFPDSAFKEAIVEGGAVIGDKLSISILIDDPKISQDLLSNQPFEQPITIKTENLLTLTSLIHEQDNISRHGPQSPENPSPDPQNRRPGYFRNFGTLHHFFISGAENHKMETVEPFIQKTLNDLKSSDQSIQPVNLEKFPDTWQTLEAYHYGYYAGRTPEECKGKPTIIKGKFSDYRKDIDNPGHYILSMKVKDNIYNNKSYPLTLSVSPTLHPYIQKSLGSSAGPPADIIMVANSKINPRPITDLKSLPLLGPELPVLRIQASGNNSPTTFLRDIANLRLAQSEKTKVQTVRFKP